MYLVIYFFASSGERDSCYWLFAIEVKICLLFYDDLSDNVKQTQPCFFQEGFVLNSVCSSHKGQLPGRFCDKVESRILLSLDTCFTKTKRRVSQELKKLKLSLAFV